MGLSQENVIFDDIKVINECYTNKYKIIIIRNELYQTIQVRTNKMYIATITNALWTGYTQLDTYVIGTRRIWFVMGSLVQISIAVPQNTHEG